MRYMYALNVTDASLHVCVVMVHGVARRAMRRCMHVCMYVCMCALMCVM